MSRPGFKRACPGFTLIELIAVMVVLGILAAVAIGRTSILVDQSHEAAAQGAIAAGQATLTQALGEVMLDSDMEDTAANVIIVADQNKPGGDYEIEFSAAGEVITITATRNDVSFTGTWTMP